MLSAATGGESCTVPHYNACPSVDYSICFEIALGFETSYTMYTFVCSCACLNFFSKALVMMDDVSANFDAQTNILQLNNNVSDEYS